MELMKLKCKMTVTLLFIITAHINGQVILMDRGVGLTR